MTQDQLHRLALEAFQRGQSGQSFADHHRVELEVMRIGRPDSYPRMVRRLADVVATGRPEVSSTEAVLVIMRAGAGQPRRAKDNLG